MGTKNKPGKFDCYAKIEADEPFFVLRAKDPTAAYLVREWARLNQNIQPAEKIAESVDCASAMDVWRARFD